MGGQRGFRALVGDGRHHVLSTYHVTQHSLLVDFDAALRDPENELRMLPKYDCGDHLHPSDLGYRTMGDAMDLTLFD